MTIDQGFGIEQILRLALRVPPTYPDDEEIDFDPDRMPEPPGRDSTRVPIRRTEKRLATLHPEIEDLAPLHYVDLDEARLQMKIAIMDYLFNPYTDDPQPPMLIVKGKPGMGKTTLVMQIIKWFLVARPEWRCLFAGPRDEFFASTLIPIIEMLHMLDDWYPWQGRRQGDPDSGHGQNCLHVPAIEEWFAKGYSSEKFCLGVCGARYKESGCVYFKQRSRKERCIYTNHANVFLSHPMMDKANVLFGDEYPLMSAANIWSIPGEYITPNDANRLIRPLLHQVRGTAERKKDPTQKEDTGWWEGEELFELLGGAQQVYDWCQSFLEAYPPTEEMIVPDIYSADMVKSVPYAHVYPLAIRLRDETYYALNDMPFIPRVIVGHDQLLLLQRRDPNDKLPRHIVWLDSTLDPRLYEAVFKRPVIICDPKVEMKARIYQVIGQSVAKTTLLEKRKDEAGKEREMPTQKFLDILDQVQRVIDREGYRRVFAITYMGGEDEVQRRGWDTLHFYGARGSNDFTDEHDVLFIIGTPQPPSDQVERAARMIFRDREVPFNTTRVQVDLPYRHIDAQGYETIVPAFQYPDDDLHAVWKQTCVAELIQTIYRARPLTKSKPIWIFSNVPLLDIPLTAILTPRDIYSAPEGMDPKKWPQVEELAERFWRENTALTAKDMCIALGIAHSSACVYIKHIAARHAARWTEVMQKAPTGRGRPTYTLVPKNLTAAVYSVKTPIDKIK